MKFNHQCAIAFTVISNDENGEDITSTMLASALLERVAYLRQTNEWVEACLPPIDTYPEE